MVLTHRKDWPIGRWALTQANGAGEKIIIKKYANRRLYDTSASAYVTLEHLSELTRQGKDFSVQDAKTGEDLTRAVLAQIIFEQENKKDGVLLIEINPDDAWAGRVTPEDVSKVLTASRSSG